MHESIYNELYHYGVIGMKWGVRKNPARAFRKATRKAKKLENKRDKLQVELVKRQNNYYDAREKLNKTKVGSSKFEKRQKKAAKLENKYIATNRQTTKATAKATKWVKKMEKHFSEVSVNDVPRDIINEGRKYAYILERK